MLPCQSLHLGAIEFGGPLASGPGIIGQAAVFNGLANNYLQAPDSGTLRVGSGSFTLALWFNVTSWSGTPVLLRKESGTSMNAGYRVDIPIRGKQIWSKTN
jgi:hypothetical protein